MKWMNDDDDDDGGIGFSPSSSDDDHCYGIDDNDTITNSSENCYIVLNEDDIRHRQDEQIKHVTSVISVSKSEASVLLCHFKWKTSQLLDHWFTNEDTVRYKVGLLSNINDKKYKNYNNVCGICFEEDLPFKNLRSVSCNEHLYCLTCWKKYIHTSIEESGPGCLTLRCPEPKCPAIVGHDMILKLTSKKNKQNYFGYFMRSYVECKESIKWCPATGCDRAIEFEQGGGNSSTDDAVTCDCSHCFCWNYGEEPHRPVECKIVVEWIEKNKSEAENTTWILAYTKHCPKCKRPIEKNNGCSHMKCRPPCR